MRVGSRLTLLTHCFPDLHATVVSGFTAIHENIILNAGVHSSKLKGQCTDVKSGCGTVSARISKLLLNSSPIRQSVCMLYFSPSCPGYGVFSSPGLRRIHSCLHTAPPLLLSARTFNNIGGISVQGARRVLPPLLLSHVKQCTLNSRVNHCRERIFKRGFYVCVVICVQCGLLPKKVYLFTLLIFRIVYSSLHC